MKFVILMFCLLGAVYANPLLHKTSLERFINASNSSESSSESSQQNDASEPSDENSNDSTSDSDTSESLESNSAEPVSDESQSHSVESLVQRDKCGYGCDNSENGTTGLEKSCFENKQKCFRNFKRGLTWTGQSDTAVTSDNTQNSKENMRRGWIYTLKWVHATYSQVQATSEPDEDDITNEVKSIDITDESTGATSKPSESSESSESQEKVGVNISDTKDSADTSESAEHTHNVDGTQYSTSNSSSSSSSSESTESSNSAQNDSSHSVECVPGTDSQDCDSEEDFPRDIGDDGATDPFNGFLMPDYVES